MEKVKDLRLEEYRFPPKYKDRRKNFKIAKWDGENNPHSFMTKEVVDIIRELYEYNGKSKLYLQQVFKISRQHLNAILAKRIWK